MKHEKPEVMEIGLQAMWDLNDKISSSPHICTIFYVSFYSSIIRETLEVMTDCRHLSGFKLQCKIFQQLIRLAEQNMIQQPIQGPDGNAHGRSTNKEYVVEFLIGSVMELFPNLNAVHVEALVYQLFNNLEEWKSFKQTLRDLMISMRSFSSQQNEIYEHERKVSTQF